MPIRYYADNEMNRKLGRVGKPITANKSTKYTPVRRKVQDTKKVGCSCGK